MKRMLQISVNLFIASLFPIIGWFTLGLFLDYSLINVFSITYPFQFVYAILVHIFGTGANICKEMENNPGAVSGGFILGSIITVILFGSIAWNADKYLLFMGYDPETYRVFTIYSLLQLGLSVIFYILIEGLYFQDRENTASKYCLIFNVLNIIILSGTAFITKSQILTCLITLITLFGYVLYTAYLFGNCTLPKFTIFQNLRYESSSICSDLFFLFIFLFGLRNVNSYGIEYMAAINFVALITDTQWDALGAVTTIAKVDISKNRFYCKRHLTNAYVLTGFLVCSSVIMLFLLYRQYNLNLSLVLKYFSFELFNFLIWAKYATDNIIVQLNYSAGKATAVKFIANTTRFFVSLLPTPFCTAIGQVSSSAIQYIGYAVFKH